MYSFSAIALFILLLATPDGSVAQKAPYGGTPVVRQGDDAAVRKAAAYVPGLDGVLEASSLR